MLDPVESVTQFHKKYGFPVNQPLTGRDGARRALLRLHLITEETGELASALAEANQEAVLDALADLLYVVAGTAVTFGLPLTLAFDEVHRSNMTKTVLQDRPGHPGKGRDYSPPDLREILEQNEGGSY